MMMMINIINERVVFGCCVRVDRILKINTTTGSWVAQFRLFYVKTL